MMPTNQKGFSLLQLVIGLGISVTVSLATVAVMIQTTETQQKSNYQFWLNSVYYQAVHVARLPVQIRNVIPDHPGIEPCLAGRGTNCAAFSNRSYPLNTVAGLNGNFAPEGLCTAPSPICRIQLNTSYEWQCSSTSCSGIQVTVDAQVLDADGLPDNDYRPRHGTFILQNLTLTARAQVSFDCQTASQQAIFGFDYQNLAANCSTYNGGNCSMPMRTYGRAPASENCQPAQSDDCSTEGYTNLGLYHNQRNCAGAYAFAPAPPPPAAVPDVPNTWVAPPPTATPPPSTPDQLWTWQGVLYITTCTGMGCDAVERASCSGPACTRATIQCYCVHPSGCHANGATQTTQPTGFCF